MFIHKLPVTDYFQLGLVLICLAAGSRSDFTKTKTKRFLAGAYVLIAMPVATLLFSFAMAACFLAWPFLTEKFRDKLKYELEEFRNG